MAKDKTKKKTSKKTTKKPQESGLVKSPDRVIAPANKAFAVLHGVKGDYIDISLLNVRLAFPNLAEPKESLDGTMKYGCALIIDDSDMKNIMVKVKMAMSLIAKSSSKLPLSQKTQEHYKTAMSLTKGEKVKGQLFRDGEMFMTSEGEVYNGFDGSFVMSVQSNAEETEPGVYKPKIALKFYDLNNEVIEDTSKIKATFYPGCYVAVRATIAAYSRPDKGAHGFSRYFSAVKFLKDGESLITRSADFENVDFSEFEKAETPGEESEGFEKADWEGDDAFK